MDLDGLEQGAFICDRGGQVLAANPIAKGLLANVIGSDHRLRFARNSSELAFARLVKAALRISSTGEPATAALELEAPQTNVVLRAMKLRRDGGPPPHADVLVFIEEQRGGPSAALRREFGLTAAEARVAIDLADGIAPEDISARQGVTLATVRSHLKSIFRKTETRGQVQLVVLVLKLLRSG